MLQLEQKPKSMRWNKFLFVLVFVPLCASADIVVVEDTVKTDKTRMVQILSKSLITEKRTEVVERFVCDTVKETTHDLGHTVVKIYRSKPTCKNVLIDETVNVIVGYDVMYEFKGKIMYQRFTKDPENFLEVYN